jgi:hypothetical protein
MEDCGPFVRLAEPTYDVSRLKHALEQVIELAGGVGEATRGDDRLQSISLTSRPGAVAPWLDGNNSQFDRATGARLYEETEFSVFNKAADDTYFREVYDTLPFSAGRMRLMFLAPITIYQMHRDSTRRAHLAISTNDDCRLVLRDGTTCHVPPDGHLHIADTTEYHTAYNAGDALRVHLVMSILDSQPAARGSSR